MCSMSSFTRSILVSSARICRYRLSPTNLYQKATFAQDAQSESESSKTETVEEESAMDDNVKSYDSIRNISRLNYPYYRQQHGLPPFDESMPSYPKHETLRFKRKMFGTYGTLSNVDPAICFPIKAEIEDGIAYEKAYGEKSIVEMRDAALLRQAEEKLQYRIREEEVRKKLVNLEQWKEKIRSKLAVKKVEASSAKQERDRILEEVRRFFGYTIDFKDEKFQIMLEFKEREMKKKNKLQQKKRKEEMLLKKLAALESGAKTTPVKERVETASEAVKQE